MGCAVEALLVAILLAQKSLIQHVSKVATRLRDGLPAGRAAVSLIVGRDVSVLDEAGVARAGIESAAENFSDAVVAPAFWYALLGLPGLFVFKVVNTADSMIGHRSPRHEAFGWSAARLDDLLNLIPARLSAGLIAAAAVAGGSAGQAIRAARRDAGRHKSPNAGWPEAAAAGALGLALGGPRRYDDRLVDGAWLNAGGRKCAGPDDIVRAARLIDRAWAMLLTIVAAAGIISLWIAQ
jgi:adenosylcobinamide-phosphate synthase